MPQRFINISQFKISSNIQLTDPNFNISSDIDLLIGAEAFWQLIYLGQIKRCKDHPTLQKTRFGWIISGRALHFQKESKNASCHLITIDDFKETISKFWQIERQHCDNATILSTDERVCETLFQQTTLRNNEGRFVIKLPVKQSILSQLGESREVAERRFFVLERRLTK